MAPARRSTRVAAAAANQKLSEAASNDNNSDQSDDNNKEVAPKIKGRKRSSLAAKSKSIPAAKTTTTSQGRKNTAKKQKDDSSDENEDASSVSDKSEVDDDEKSDKTPPPPPPKSKRASPAKRKIKTSESTNEKDAEAKASSSSSINNKKKSKKLKGDSSAKTKNTDSGASSEEEAEEKAPAPPKKVKPPAHQVLTERDELPKLWNAANNVEGSYTMKIASWNVAGLRAVLRNTPTALADLVTRHNLDILCLQETKLQESHLTDPKLELAGHVLDAEGYDGYWSCSTVKKGYAGTAVFVRRRSSKRAAEEESKDTKKKQTTLTSFFSAGKESQNENGEEEKTSESSSTSNHLTVSTTIDAKHLIPETVSYTMGSNSKHDGEGRIIVLDFPLFSLCNVYVPNSGQTLERLAYRTQEWDKDLLAFVQEKQKARNRPVLWLGDLNVAHTHLEVWNDGAKHLPKQAGVTPEERASFQAQLDAGFVDAFRKLHPTAKGHYSYWSQRAGNRAPNKGLRLDYFVCDPSMFQDGDNDGETAQHSKKVLVRDSYMLYDQEGSDHCPVVLELEIRP